VRHHPRDLLLPAWVVLMLLAAGFAVAGPVILLIGAA
jgi:hypothetical protein